MLHPTEIKMKQKYFSNKAKLKEFISNRPAHQNLLKEVLQAEKMILERNPDLQKWLLCG
jgi:hypothetical protein